MDEVKAAWCSVVNSFHFTQPLSPFLLPRHNFWRLGSVLTADLEKALLCILKEDDIYYLKDSN